MMMAKGTTTTTNSKPDADVDAAFAAYYLQQATRELAGDLDALRGSDDFASSSTSTSAGTGSRGSRGDEALAMLVRALRQGASTLPLRDRRRVVLAAARGAVEVKVEGGEGDEGEEVADQEMTGMTTGDGEDDGDGEQQQEEEARTAKRKKREERKKEKGEKEEAEAEGEGKRKEKKQKKEKKKRRREEGAAATE